MPSDARLPSSITTADLRDAAEYLRQRADKIMDQRPRDIGRNIVARANAAARANAMHRIAEYLDAKALSDA